ncbi:transmembrane protein 65-like [Polypterus senegalus]|uniref:transmembrane protein 65-like n=1 Tax=Polypterus senegalus TaxID=55291 RepID=UPI0019632BB0|nr:transmembrane protein 65-like [Polypterus senegalus]
MLPCLGKLMRPTFSLKPGLFFGKVPVPTAIPVRWAQLSPRTHFGTHPHKEPMEPLNSPQGAREFIYSLHPSERSCLLRELHRFESIAIAQVPEVSRYSKRPVPLSRTPGELAASQEKLEMAPPSSAQLRYGKMFLSM